FDRLVGKAPLASGREQHVATEYHRDGLAAIIPAGTGFRIRLRLDRLDRELLVVTLVTVEAKDLPARGEEVAHPSRTVAPRPQQQGISDAVLPEIGGGARHALEHVLLLGLPRHDLVHPHHFPAALAMSGVSDLVAEVGAYVAILVPGRVGVADL